MACFHCSGTNQCDCISCGAFIMAMGRPEWVDGKCAVCTARAYVERHRAIYDATDPRKRENWTHHPAKDGSKGYRTYNPLKGKV